VVVVLGGRRGAHLDAFALLGALPERDLGE